MLLAALTAAAVDPKVEACGPERAQAWICSLTYDVTDSKRAAEIADALATPLRVVLILIVTWVVVRLVNRAIARAADRLRREGTLSTLGRKTWLVDSTPDASLRRAQRADTVSAVLRNATAVVAWSIAVLLALGELGIDLAPLLAGVGVVGIAVGFGAQAVVRDYLAGLFIVLEDQFGVGDVVDLGAATGTVESVNLRRTRLRDVHGVVWHVPNGEIRRVGNQSQQWARALLDVAVRRGVDLDAAADLVRQTALEMWRDPAWADVMLAEPEVWGVEDVAPDRVLLRLAVQTRPSEQWRVGRELRARLAAAVDRAGMMAPAPADPPGSPPPDPSDESGDGPGPAS